jgi:hypothetical protein
MNNQTWFLPFAQPTASKTILEDEQYFNEAMSPLFNNIKHPYNPQYRHNNIAGELNHNMLEGQPNFQKKHFFSKYTNESKELNLNQIGLLENSQIKDANIHWIDNNKTQKMEYNPYQISSNYKTLPNGSRNFNNPHKIKGPITQIIPWDTFQELNKKDDEYFNERNFQEILNHPFYQHMKPFLEQPFKHL